MTNLNFKDCNCKDGHNENVCEKSTGECGDCKMGFHGESCDKGNKEKPNLKVIFVVLGLKSQSVYCKWIGFKVCFKKNGDMFATVL